MDETYADGCADLMAIHVLRHLREDRADPFGYFDGLFPVGLKQHRGKVITAEATDEIRTTHRFSRGFRKHRQDSVANRMTVMVSKTLPISAQSSRPDRIRRPSAAL